MRIGIITFHKSLNYGAVLQCYALNKCLKNKKYAVSLIDYRPEEDMSSSNPFHEARDAYIQFSGKNCLYRLYRATRRGLKTLMDVKGRKRLKDKRHLFNSFLQKYFDSTEVYSSLNELKRKAPLCDAYICGSDQLWNPALTEGKYDPAYFLSFGNSDTIRIAYAVSACNLPESYDNELKSLLSNIDYVSIRENKNKRKIEELSGMKVEICPDPSLLLSAEEYQEIEEVVDINKKYIFVYLLWKGNTPDLTKAILEQIRKDVPNISVIDASPVSYIQGNNVQAIDDPTPGQWLSLIDNASFVITNSFHCASFSTIFNKEVYILPCAETNRERLYELCERLRVSDHYISCISDISSIAPIDYSDVNSLIDGLRRRGIEFLDKSLASVSSKN